TGGPMDDARPLFSTFKPIGEDNKASAKPGPNTTPVQPQGAEQPRGHHDADGRVGWGGCEGSVPPPQLTVPMSPSSHTRGDQLVALRARTRLWFEQTQAKRLGATGELPAWFHGFVSRRETEQLLQDQPPGCFLVRFSESTVGFVLSYRGRERCRHFVLDQLPDGRYVILGERSAHAELADLLRHYAAAPLTPYHEFLTVPRGRVRIRPLVSPRSRKSGGHSCCTEPGGGGGGGGRIFPSWGSPSNTRAGVGSAATLQHPSRNKEPNPAPRWDQHPACPAPHPHPGTPL
ncbi:SH22A protein, partial [Chroicocephalus maculipennis]|nr:SH22A protein [Chroicocephalus maculipennis]